MDCFVLRHYANRRAPFSTPENFPEKVLWKTSGPSGKLPVFHVFHRVFHNPGFPALNSRFGCFFRRFSHISTFRHHFCSGFPQLSHTLWKTLWKPWKTGGKDRGKREKLRAKFTLTAPSSGAKAPPSPSYGGRLPSVVHGLDVVHRNLCALRAEFLLPPPPHPSPCGAKLLAIFFLHPKGGKATFLWCYAGYGALIFK